VRAGEVPKPDPDATSRAASPWLRACQPGSVLPGAAPLSCSFSRLAGRPAFLRHVAGARIDGRVERSQPHDQLLHSFG
jgi:hypothetical protein